MRIGRSLKRISTENEFDKPLLGNSNGGGVNDLVSPAPH